jgi:hypothetical protein
MREDETQFEDVAAGLNSPGDYSFSPGKDQDSRVLRLRHSRARASLINQRLHLLGVPAALYFDDKSSDVLLEWQFSNEQAKQAQGMLRRLKLSRIKLPA